MAAVAIRSNLEAITQDQAEETEDDVADAPEGAVLTRTHRVRERNRKIVARKKAEALKANGNLSCEGCKFDFAATYGERGEGFIECHHTVPVSNLKKGHRTKLSDLALLCSNCHRIVHRRQPWLDLTALQNLVQPIHPGS